MFFRHAIDPNKETLTSIEKLLQPSQGDLLFHMILNFQLTYFNHFALQVKVMNKSGFPYPETIDITP